MFIGGTAAFLGGLLLVMVLVLPLLINSEVLKALTAAGVEMPFETIQLAPHKVTVQMSGEQNDEHL